MLLLGILATFIVVAAVSYAGFLFWNWVYSLRKEGKLDIAGKALAVIVGFMSFSLGGISFASTPTLEFDLTPFFDSLNAYLPIFIGLFAIVGGIAGAMALARYVVSAVVRAFSGGTI